MAKKSKVKIKKFKIKKLSDKQYGKLLLKVVIIGFFIVLFIASHVVQVDHSDFSEIDILTIKHIFQHPFDIFPINWNVLGVVAFVYFVGSAFVYVYYEKHKNTRPGEENGSAKWNDDFGAFASKYAEPFGFKKIEQDTGWIDNKTGSPWSREKNRSNSYKDKEKTKSFVVAIKNLLKKKIGFFIKRKVNFFKKRLISPWLNLKAKFYENTVVEGEDEVVVPSDFQRKIYTKVCDIESKLDMNLDRYKPKACLEEKRRLEEEEKKKEAEELRIANMRKMRYVSNLSPKEKLTPSLIPVNRNMILSQNVALSMDQRATRKNCNTLIIGGSGAGKTRFFLKPNLMQRNCSYVITDPSGEILETMGKFLENAGYEIKVINLTQKDHSHCYNPFNYVRTDADILVMIDVLTKNLTPPDSHTSDPFWPKAQAALLQAIAFYLYKECVPSERNFTNVMKLLRAAVVDEKKKSPLDIIFEDLEKEKGSNHIAVMQYSIFKQAPEKTASTILTCAEVDLAPFNLEEIANLMCIDTVKMDTIALKPTALFCITPTATTTFNWIISLAYTQLFDTLYHIAETKCKGKRLPVHVRFLLDEFANIGQIPDFAQKLSTMRKYEISSAIILQNMAQLETMYKDDWKTIVGNCDAFIYLGGHESSSTEYVSKMLGKQTIKSKNSSRTYGRQGSNNISLNATGRELMTPDEIAHMSDQDCLVMVKGVMPFFDKKYDLEQHPNYQFTGDADDDLLFDIEAEIHTPNNNLSGSTYEGKVRQLQHEAKHDGRNADRSHIMGTMKKSVTAVNKENLESAGIYNNLYNLNDNLEDKGKSNVAVVGSNLPNDEFAMDAASKAASEDNFDSFLDGAIDSAVDDVGNVELDEFDSVQ